MEDFKLRLIDELNELHKKRLKLVAFIGTETFSSLNQNQRKLLIKQEDVMLLYERILQLRLDDLGVDYAD